MPSISRTASILELQKLYFDIARASFPMVLAALLKLAQPTHILLGTDFSPEAIESTVDPLPAFGLRPDVMRAIERGNAERLFPHFKV
jgi:6-methylsalicylate decarboxylase